MVYALRMLIFWLTGILEAEVYLALRFAMRSNPANDLGNRTLTGVLWSLTERFSSQAIGFIVILIMARLLTPADYGLVGMLTIFIEIGSSLTDSGFSQALIRRKELTKTDTSTVFYFNVAAGLFLYSILWISAPHIANYYDQPLLTSLARAIGILIPVNALTVVQRASLSASLNFKTQAHVSVIAYILSGTLGIWLAATGSGVWAIVAYQLSSQALYCVLLWIFGRWWPSMKFSLSAFRNMFGFGSLLAVAGLIDIAYRNSYLMLIGKVYKASDLGYFTRSQQIGGFLSANLSGVIQRVSYPALCGLQDDEPRLAGSFLKMCRISAFFIFPLMWCLIGLPDPVVGLLLGPKWNQAAVLLPPLALSFMWHPLQSLNLQLIQVRGRSDLFLRVEIIKKCFGAAVLLLTLSHGVLMICWGLVISNVFSYICNTWFNRSFHGAGIIPQLKVSLPPFITGGIAAAIAALTSRFFNHDILKLLVGISSGAVVYIGWAVYTKREEIKLCKRIFQKIS